MQTPDPLKEMKQELHLYTLSETATTLKVSRSTIKNWISQDNILPDNTDPRSFFAKMQKKVDELAMRAAEIVKKYDSSD